MYIFFTPLKIPYTVIHLNSIEQKLSNTHSVFELTIKLRSWQGNTFGKDVSVSRGFRQHKVRYIAESKEPKPPTPNIKRWAHRNLGAVVAELEDGVDNVATNGGSSTENGSIS